MNYLSRTAGLNFLTQLEQNSFAELIMLNTTGVTHLPHDVFSTPAHTVEAGDPSTWVLPSGLTGKIFQQGGTLANGGTLRYTGEDHIVIGGTAGNDKIISGAGDDTVWGDGGNDIIEGGDGNDALIGGAGDDIITDIHGFDTIKGGDGNDVINAGGDEDLIIAGAGKDFVWAGEDLKEVFAGDGDDFISGGDAESVLFGGEGDDWLEGDDGPDLLQGDNGDPLLVQHVRPRAETVLHFGNSIGRIVDLRLTEA